MPELMISPMLDLIFLLLAFFIISTMYMTEGSYWLDDKKMPLATIVAEVKKRSGADENYSVVIRGEKEAAYDKVIHVLDQFKASGITKFGLATEQGEDG